MRHLIDPMDLTVEEIDQLLAVGDDIIQNPARAKNWLPCSMSQAPAPD